MFNALTNAVERKKNCYYIKAFESQFHFRQTRELKAEDRTIVEREAFAFASTRIVVVVGLIRSAFYIPAI